MALSQRFMWDIDRQIKDATNRKKKRREFDQNLRNREISEMERQGRFDRKKAKSDAVHARGDAALSFLDRQNDAFEVAAGRQDPAYFNMKYGGGTSTGGVSRKGAAGTATGADEAPDYGKMLIDAYKASGSDLDGNKEDFLDFADRTLPELQKQFPSPQQQTLDPWEMRRKKNAMDYGNPVTKDFQDNVTTSTTPEGALRFSDNGLREGDTKLATGWDASKQAVQNRMKMFGGGPEGPRVNPAPQLRDIVTSKSYSLVDPANQPDKKKPTAKKTTGNPRKKKLTEPAPLIDTQSFKKTGRGVRDFFHQWMIPGAQAFNQTMYDVGVKPFVNLYNAQKNVRNNSTKRWQGYK